METAVHEEAYTVQRPVVETAEREETFTVMKPVYETAYRTECHTVLQPVTTCRTQYVDHGCFSQQVVLKPALPVTRLTWQSGACTVDPVTGRTVYQHPGLYWTQTPRGQYEVQQVWHPNVVAQQVSETTMVPQTVSQQVPMQVCKYVPEQMVRKVPVQVCRMVTEQQVRHVPVTTCKIVYEQRVEQVPYQVCRMVAEPQTIRVPHCVEKQIPVTYTCNVPRLVCYRVPLDACGEPLVEAPVVPVAPWCRWQPVMGPPPGVLQTVPAPSAPPTNFQPAPVTTSPSAVPQPQPTPAAETGPCGCEAGAWPWAQHGPAAADRNGRETALAGTAADEAGAAGKQPGTIRDVSLEAR